MKKVFFITCLMLSLGSAFSQKDKKKDEGDPFLFDKKTGLVTDNTGNLLFKIEYIRSVSYPGINDYYFRNSDNKLLIVFKYETYQDPRLMSQANPKGNENYYEIKFFTDPVVESECGNKFLKGLVKMVYEKKLIENGNLNLDMVKEFSIINGHTYSRRRSELMRY